MSKKKGTCTIAEAISIVLQNEKKPLSYREIYKKIVEGELYHFAAKSPLHIVQHEIRRHCEGVEIGASTKNRLFSIAGQNESGLLYQLKDGFGNTNVIVAGSDDEKTDEEKILDASRAHNELIAQTLMEKLLNSPPAFFENVVVDLLLKMGYGYDSNSGIVTGKSHDGGIDGEINEDKLGLDKIYIQAKRYAKSNHISRNDLQAFVGAMEGVQKGVFITTSSFTNEAKKFASANQVKHIKLIDGDMLTSLMINYRIGVTVRKTVSIYSIDQSYFE